MFIGTRQERELMQARERYWHDRASLCWDYEEQIRAKDEQILELQAKLHSQASEAFLQKLKRLKFERECIAKMLERRFDEPVETSLTRLIEIDSLETLEQLADYSVVCKDYKSFLEKLASYGKQNA